MKFFTILILAYTCQQEPVQSKIVFTSAAKCSKAMSALLPPMRELYGDTDAYCQATDVPSSSVRPRARPTS